MVFSSVVFIFFFLPLVLGGYYVLGKKYRNSFLLIASLFFYAWGEPVFVLVMLISILLNWGMACCMDSQAKKCRKRIFLIVTLICDLGILFVFKYLNFCIRNINNAVGTIVIRQTEISLPIGISFFTFQAISYIVDVYRGDGAVQRNPIGVALYIALFPQLIAGPIVRYQTIAEEIVSRRETLDDFTKGITRFIIGLGKKALLANTLALLADSAFAETGTFQLTTIYAWLGAISYSLQIYFDFSGYSDMAIGLGAMFGFHFMENFDHPYISGTITEFWRRWHISLGSWFRDYVYIPLGGSRVGNLRMICNLLIVWLLTGLWHGANWTFICWGLVYCIALIIEKMVIHPWNRKKWFQIIYRIISLIYVIIAWVIFRSDSIANANMYIKVMFSFQPISTADIFLIKQYGSILLIGMMFAMPIVPRLQKWINKAFPRMGRTIMECCTLIWIVAIGFLSIACVVSSTYNPFIYFNF